MQNLVSGKRVLITQATDFMGPTLCQVFAEQGAQVVASEPPLTDPQAAAAAVAQAGALDILVANLSLPAPNTPAAEVQEAEWRAVFATLVDPLPRLVQAVVPIMAARGGGKILVIGSASALRGMKRTSTYSAARGAQLAYVQAVGVELAPLKIQVNAIAQNFVDNPTYFPPRSPSQPPVPGASGPRGPLGTPGRSPRRRPLRRLPVQPRRRLFRGPGVPGLRRLGRPLRRFFCQDARGRIIFAECSRVSTSRPPIF